MKEKTPFNVRCSACGHVWAAAWLPMEMRKAAKLLKNTSCPQCAAPPKLIFMALNHIALTDEKAAKIRRTSRKKLLKAQMAKTQSAASEGTDQ